MAKTGTEELRVFLNGERLGYETINGDIAAHTLTIDDAEIGWMLQSMTFHMENGQPAIHAVTEEFLARDIIARHRYCEHPRTQSVGMEAKQGGIIMDIRCCEVCGRTIRHPYESGVS